MAVDRSLWERDFAELPSWPCPTCQQATLRLLDGSLQQRESGRSARLHDHPDWNPEWDETRFVALMRCHVASCGEVVAVAGRMGWEYDYTGNSMHPFYRPLSLHPAPNVFRLPETCPEALSHELKRAFALLWSDPGSAANRLRAAVEILLTELGVPRTTVNKERKRVPLQLHARIERFAARSADASEFLMAIKWLGNAGSHATLDVDRDTLLAGFELFEQAVDLIYIGTLRKLKKAAQDLTLRKGKPPATTRRRRRRRSGG